LADGAAIPNVGINKNEILVTVLIIRRIRVSP
jgi:hypothetical protein